MRWEVFVGAGCNLAEFIGFLVVSELIVGRPRGGAAGAERDPEELPEALDSDKGSAGPCFV